ncbi:aspartate/glutamate racemase family protein [Mycolicibacterium peregrinum]|nr:aspartate/glutamate racemase family protein [Mycolicibacterium peregrinum]
MRSVIVVNPNSNGLTTDMLVRRFRRSMDTVRLSSGTTDVVGVTAASGPSMITTPQALSAAAGHVRDAVCTVAPGIRPDAVIVCGFGDPGVQQLRDCLTVPVIGIGEASLRYASRGGTRFGIVTTTGDLVEALTQMVHSIGLTHLFTGVQLTPTEPLQLAGLPDLSNRELAAAVQQALGDGAEKVIIGGGPLSSAADYLEQLYPGVIVDPVYAAAWWAAQLTTPHSLHRYGTRDTDERR